VVARGWVCRPTHQLTRVSALLLQSSRGLLLLGLGHTVCTDATWPACAAWTGRSVLYGLQLSITAAYRLAGRCSAGDAGYGWGVPLCHPRAGAACLGYALCVLLVHVLSWVL
jgi:hypothetical protein